MNPFDPTKLVPDEKGHLWAVYENKQPARVLCADGNGKYPVVTMDFLGDVRLHSANGKALVGRPWDLFNPPTKIKVDGWLVKYKDWETTQLWTEQPNKDEWDRCGIRAVRRIQLELTEGEGRPT